MKIVKIELFPVTLGPRPGQNAKLRNNSVVIKITTDSGHVGIGDTGNTSSWYNGETQGSIIAVIEEVIAPLVLLGSDPFDIERIVDKMDHLVRNNGQAKMLVDFALHDLKGKVLDVPAYQLLGGRTVEKIRLGYVSAERDPDILGEWAADAVYSGFALIKIKIGLTGNSMADECKRLAAVRKAIEDKIPMDLDANGALNFKQALAGVKAFAEFRPGLIEQPLPSWDLDGMARLRETCTFPVYADEAAQTPTDIMEIHRKGAADGLLLKPVKAGGFVKSLRWIATAQACGYPVVIGSMAGSGLETIAHLHLATANAWTSTMIHEIVGPLRRRGESLEDMATAYEDIVHGGPVYKDGCALPPEGPGFGLELNEEVIARRITPGRSVVTVTADNADAKHDGYRAVAK
ncbi:mandelate racemase/muconate lactonizing enzyme family protein [Azospirillum griseum]|uniref:Mandelate racemase n=1 Tax=Azospirillum griseum TaxID=2496639 RepID=A0A431VAI9_9PROT|nr:mandelate racemase/muconate lactonizing enzyme family protein [Azospirillum griseum]RTR14607.1 mandelate racemase [Azospirillum griseum]